MAIKIILKTALKWIIKSLLIPWLLNNFDILSTKANNKLIKLMEKL